MADGRADDASWSRAYLASSGLGSSQVRRRQVSAEWHEASGADLARPRFAELAHHRDVDVREVLARRDDCPLGVLASLAHDARAVVRVAVAANPAANAAVLEELARDRDAAVLKAVARNRSTAPEVRDRLARHRRPDVRRVAERAALELGDGQGAPEPGSLGVHQAVLPHELRDRALDGDADTAPPARRLPPRAYAPRPAVGPAAGRPRRAAEGAEHAGSAVSAPSVAEGRRAAFPSALYLPDGPHPATG